MVIPLEIHWRWWKLIVTSTETPRSTCICNRCGKEMTNSTSIKYMPGSAVEAYYDFNRDSKVNLHLLSLWEGEGEFNFGGSSLSLQPRP